MGKLNIILVRYLFAFLFFALFLLLLFVPILHYANEFELNNELNHITNRLDQGINTFNSLIASLNSIITLYNMDTRFNTLWNWNYNPPEMEEFNKMSPVSLLQLRDLFIQTLVSHPLPLDTGIVFPNGAMVTSTGIIYYRPGDMPYYGILLQCDELTFEEWQLLLTNGSAFIPERTYSSGYFGDFDAITYTAVWGYMGFPNQIIFFATLPIDGIIKLLMENDIAETAYVKMYTAENKLLFARGDSHDGTFHVIRRENAAHSISYEIGIPDSYISVKMRPLRNMLLLYAGITVVFFILLSGLFAWRISKPERTFIEHVGLQGAGFTKGKFGIFKGYKDIYQDLAKTISVEKNQLETSLQMIESQTELIRVQTIDRIKKALFSGDEYTAQLILHECYSALSRSENSNITQLLVKMLLDMIQNLRQELSELSLDIEPPGYFPDKQEDFFRNQFPLYFTIICEKIRANKKKNISVFGREVQAYIDGHIYDPQLYLTMVADHFDISPPTVQKLVKQCTGQTFLNYIEKRRLEHAYELLSKTNENITNIAINCGFSGIVTFSRAFKRKYGFPPSQLREMQP